MTVFEPNTLYPLNGHTAFLNIAIIDGIKSYLKDIHVCLDLEYNQPKNKSEKLTFF